MENAGYRSGKWAVVLRAALLFTALCGVAGCATITTWQGGIRTIWHGRDQFVAIVGQDHHPGSAVAANAHPVDISAELLRSAFGAIEVRLPDQDTAVQLFNDPELEILAKYVRMGLATAGPDEDVTFAVVGDHALLTSFLKERMVTTGRVFYRNGRLNVIFGDVLRDLKENEDRRLHPLRPGSRATTSSHDWVLTAKAGSEGFAMQRPDWVTFPLSAPAAPVAASPAMQERGSSAQVSQKAVSPGAPHKPSVPGRQDIAERLKRLNELRDKRLITDEEYRTKRQKILDEL
jgi:hypothetical protein